MTEVVAVGTAVNTKLPRLGQLIEEAMVRAILQCSAEGITDPAVIRQRKIEAMEEVKAKVSL